MTKPLMKYVPKNITAAFEIFIKIVKVTGYV